MIFFLISKYLHSLVLKQFIYFILNRIYNLLHIGSRKSSDRCFFKKNFSISSISNENLDLKNSFRSSASPYRILNFCLVKDYYITNPFSLISHSTSGEKLDCKPVSSFTSRITASKWFSHFDMTTRKCNAWPVFFYDQ